jgi:hypothetical protein
MLSFITLHFKQKHSTYEVLSVALVECKGKKFHKRHNVYNPVSCPNHLCGLVVRVPGYRSRGLGSIADATRFSEK